MTINQFIKHMENLAGCVCFEYNGYNCGVDPLSRNKFEMWYGQDCVTAGSIDEVMAAKFYNGKSLTTIWDCITDLDY